MAESSKRKIEEVESDPFPIFPKLIRITDKAAKALLEDKPIEKDQDPFRKEFYEHPNTFLIGPNMRARMEFNHYNSCNYIYLSRQYGKKDVSVIRWSFFESLLRLLDELEKFLQSYNDHPKSGLEALSLISYFDGKDPERAFEYEKKDWDQFWTQPDIRCEIIMAKFGHKKETNTYVMLLHNPVRDDKRAYSWRGPLFYLSLPAMEMLAEYLRYAHRMAIYDPPSKKVAAA